MESLIHSIKEKLKESGISPNKRLGQNFLISPLVYKKIIAAAKIKPSDTVVEVGPGLGILTEYLASSCGKLVAVEKDALLAQHLESKFTTNFKVKIVNQDILKFKPSDFSLQPEGYKVVGNIPYYLTSHLFRIIFESWPSPELVVFMVQKEVAKRIVASPPEMNLLAVSVQYFGEPEIVDYVSKNNFYPAPKVDSAIIKIEVKNRKQEHTLEKAFFKLARVGFSTKRKQLVNSLSTGLKMPKEKVLAGLFSAGIEHIRRAETLSLKEWEKLAEALDLSINSQRG